MNVNSSWIFSLIFPQLFWRRRTFQTTSQFLLPISWPPFFSHNSLEKKPFSPRPSCPPLPVPTAASPPPPDKPLFCTCPSTGGGEPRPVMKYCEWLSSLHQTHTGGVSCLDPADLIRALVGVNKGLAGGCTVYFGQAGEAGVASRNVLLPANTCARICPGTRTRWVLRWTTCASKRKRKLKSKCSLQWWKYSTYLVCTCNRCQNWHRDTEDKLMASAH